MHLNHLFAIFHEYFISNDQLENHLACESLKVWSLCWYFKSCLFFSSDILSCQSSVYPAGCGSSFIGGVQELWADSFRMEFLKLMSPRARRWGSCLQEVWGHHPISTLLLSKGSTWRLEAESLGHFWTMLLRAEACLPTLSQARLPTLSHGKKSL